MKSSTPPPASPAGSVVPSEPAPAIVAELAAIDVRDESYAARFVDALLLAGRRRSASDIHLLPGPRELEVRWRLDGVLQSVGSFSPGVTTNVIMRLKVLADLLTYRSDLPQEGRIRASHSDAEMRVSTFPTVHGERAVVRIFTSGGEHRRLDDLGLAPDIQRRLAELLTETSGAILLTGPAGSGKTTTAYACLRELVADAGFARSIVTLEDPVEVLVEGVSQSQVQASAGLDFPTGLRSLLRQDPEVLFIGEIRDRITAEVSLEASLTGHLMLSSFHAGSAAGAISRLFDMGIEPYAIQSGVRAIVCQRLVPSALCRCARPADDRSRAGLLVDGALMAVGCPDCGHTGYRGRRLIAEMLPLGSAELRAAILARGDLAAVQRAGVADGLRTLWRQALEMVTAGVTSPVEVRRVLGGDRLET